MMKIIYKILLLILFFALTECATSLPKNNKLLQHKWYGYGGAVILDLQPNHKFKFLMVGKPQVSGTWQVQEKQLILSNPKTASKDTYSILRLSKDSLRLDFVIKKFGNHLPSTGKNIKRKYSKEEIISYFSDKKFKIIGDNLNKTAFFDKKGQYSLDTTEPYETYKWKIEPLGNYYFLIVTGFLHQQSFSRIVGVSKNRIELEVYPPHYNEKGYHLTMELMEGKSLQ